MAGNKLDSNKKANLLIIFIVAIIGFGMSNIVFSLTGDYVNSEITQINNQNQKLIAINDGNFTPNQINTVEIVNDTNTTNNTTIDIPDGNNNSDYSI